MQTLGPTHVIILAADALHRATWEALLQPQPGMMVWGTVCGPDAIHARDSTPGRTTILIDLNDPLPTILHKLKVYLPDYGYLCLITHYEMGLVVSMLQAGATGCLIRDATVPNLARAIIATGRGEIVLPPSMVVQALAALARGILSPEPAVDQLALRESEILNLLAMGLTNKDIAQQLFLSVRTVEAHLRNIYSKLNVGSRTEAVLWAFAHGQELTDNQELGSFT